MAQLDRERRPMLERRSKRTATNSGNGSRDVVVRLGALAGAAALVGFAARRRSPLAVSGATAAAIPLVMRGATGHWPLESAIAQPVHVRTAISIRRSAEEIWDFWRKLENLPRFMRHLESVETIDTRRSRWVARTPIGQVSWEAEITEESRPRHLAWRSTEGSTIDTRGRLDLSEAAKDRGTLMHVDITIEPPGGRAGRLAAALLRRVTAREIEHDLRRFKSLLEAGEIATTDGQPHGAREPRPTLFSRGAQRSVRGRGTHHEDDSGYAGEMSSYREQESERRVRS